MKKFNLKAIRGFLFVYFLILMLALTLSSNLFAQQKDVLDSNASGKEAYEMSIPENLLNKPNDLSYYEKKIMDSSKNTSENREVRALGDTIAQTFPDPIMAQAVADNIASGNISTIIDQTMIDQTFSLNLSNRQINNIEGISVFSNLNALYLDRNNLSNIPIEIETLDYLTFIVLDFNNFSSIPTEITDLTNLRVLSMGSNNLSDISLNISNLTNLWYLSLRNNHIQVITPELLSIQSLEHLDLGLNDIAEIPAGIENLVNLQYLDLAANQQIPEIPIELCNLGNLKHLDISYNYSLSVIPPEIDRLTNLEYLDLSGNNIVEMTLNLFDLNSLKNLFITNNKILEIPSDIGKLTNLEYLRLNSNQIPAIPIEMKNLSSLIELALSGNKIPEIPVEICNLPNLEILGLSSNKITAIPKEINQLLRLNFLSLDANFIEELPTELGGLSELEILYLSNNRIKIVPNELGDLSQLKYLYLDFNQIKILPTDLTNLSELINLNISFNQINTLPAEITNLNKLDWFVFSCNQLISLSQAQYDFCIQLDNKYDYMFGPPYGAVAYEQKYEEILPEVGIETTDYEFNAHPAYKQFPNYGVVFMFSLLLPDGTTKEITPIFENEKIIIPGNELVQLGEYCLIANDVTLSKLFPVEYKSFFKIESAVPAPEPIEYISAQANGEKDKVTSTNITIEISRIPEEGDLSLDNIALSSADGTTMQINKEGLIAIGNNQYQIVISGSWNEDDLVDVTLSKGNAAFVPKTRQATLHKNKSESNIDSISKILPKTGSQKVSLSVLLLVTGTIVSLLHRFKPFKK